MKTSITNVGKKLILFNSIFMTAIAIEYYGYSYFLYNTIRKNFSSTPLKDSGSLSEPVLILHKDKKFVFSHKGGPKAANSLMADSFKNNKLFPRAILFQLMTLMALSIGILKSKRYMIPFGGLSVIGNICYGYPIAFSSINLFHLSQLVRDGNAEVWENLNEARYFQRLREIEEPQLVYSRLGGITAICISITYFTPFIGALLGTLVYKYSVHKKI
jgi:hypothetical protein